MLNSDTGRGQSIFIAEDYEDAVEASSVEFVPVADETELFTAFWDCNQLTTGASLKRWDKFFVHAAAQFQSNG